MSGLVCLAAFSRTGAALAEKISADLGGEVWGPKRCAVSAARVISEPLCEWAGKMFSAHNAIIFVSACGIAVRAIAPHLRSKEDDPAVVVLDERGRYVISLLSGHLGGANALAKRIARITGGVAVITTATDVNGIPAVDEWAKEHNCAIENLIAVKKISAAALEDVKIGVAVTEELYDAPWPVTLWLRPRNIVLGVGCKKGVPFERIRAASLLFLEESGVSPLSIKALASIDVKKAESGLMETARYFGVPLVTFSAEELKNVPGHFTHSERVEAAVGVDNVCERAAVLQSGGFLLRGKTRFDGITLAMAKSRRDKR